MVMCAITVRYTPYAMRFALYAVRQILYAELYQFLTVIVASSCEPAM